MSDSEFPAKNQPLSAGQTADHFNRKHRPWPPQESEPAARSARDWVTIAVIGRTRGNEGEVFAEPLTSRPDRFETLCEVFLFGHGERREIESSWFHRGRLILKFRGIDNITDAERLRGAEVRVPLRDRVDLDPGEYFQSDLIGCEAVTPSGEILGQVSAWQDSGGAGLLELDTGLLIPFARAICREVDIARRRILVELPEGLKELNRP